jgi:hypothetical protein
MTKKLLFVTTLLLVLTFVLCAADVTGKWTYEQPSFRQGGNPTTVTLNLKAEGGKLTGTRSQPGRDGNVMEAPISEGKIDGDNISFKTVQEFNGNSFTTSYSGTVSGSEIKLKVTRPGRDGNTMTNEVTAKKATT